MLFASLLGIFAIPPLYVLFQGLRERVRPSIRPENRERQPLAEAEKPPLPVRPLQPADGA
jgi:hypothetical protein